MLWVLLGTLKVQSFILTEVSEGSLLVVTFSTFLNIKDMLIARRLLTQIIKTRSPAYVYTNVLCTHVRSTCILRFSRCGFFRLSRCPSHTWAHIKYLSSLCVCTCVYKHTPTHHPNTCKIKEIYKTKPLSLPPPKHSLSHQQQALTMNKMKQNPLPIPPHTRMQVLRNTCDTRACSREIGQYN